MKWAFVNLFASKVGFLTRTFAPKFELSDLPLILFFQLFTLLSIAVSFDFCFALCRKMDCNGKQPLVLTLLAGLKHFVVFVVVVKS